MHIKPWGPIKLGMAIRLEFAGRAEPWVVTVIMPSCQRVLQEVETFKNRSLRTWSIQYLAFLRAPCRPAKRPRHSMHKDCSRVAKFPLNMSILVHRLPHEERQANGRRPLEEIDRRWPAAFGCPDISPVGSSTSLPRPRGWSRAARQGPSHKADPGRSNSGEYLYSMD